MQDNEPYDPDKLERLSVARMVCKRPLLYTASGSIDEVFAFLSGYTMGAQCAQTKPADDSPYKAIDWFNKKCQIPNSISFPKESVSRIRATFPSSESALQELDTYLKQIEK